MSIRAIWITGLLVASTLIASSQGVVQINHLAHGYDCELDTNRDGLADGFASYGTWGDSQASVEAAGASFAIDRRIKFSGFASQRITIARSTGSAGTLSFRIDAIRERDFFKPEVNAPLLIRFYYRIDRVQNVRFSVSVTSGQRSFQVWGPVSQPTGGWAPVTVVVPVEADANGQPYLRIRFNWELLEGPAQMEMWLDSLSALGLNTSSPNPYSGLSPIRLLSTMSPPSSWMEYLLGDLRACITSAANVYPLALVRPDILWGYYIHCQAHSQCSIFELIDYCYADRHHPEWFLTDSAGNRVVRSNNEDAYIMDLANPQLRAHAVARIQQLAESVPAPRAIFLDNALTWGQSVQYPTESSFLNARIGYVQAITQAFRQHWPNTLIILNNGGRAGRYLDGNWGTNWIDYVDGVTLENVIVSSDGRSYSYAAHYHRVPASNSSGDWYTIMRAVYAYPNKHWWLIMCPNLDDTNMVRYAIASYLMLCRENTALMLQDRGKPTSLHYRLASMRPELYVPLGRPLGDFRVEQGQIASGALFARDFQYGIALVNPHPELSFQYRTTRAYKDWDGNVIPANTLLTIGPRQGVVLYAAPEITVEITPSQTTVLPEETLTFTVRYQNNGLVDATNVKISVPLPEGLEFVSSSTGGQYQNRQITWTLSQVRAGRSGTLTFQARVQ